MDSPSKETQTSGSAGLVEAKGPLGGIRILDVATFIAGPFCATLLAEFGADVIKVEMPGKGDPMRQMGQQFKGVGLTWAQEARNRRGITCDLRNPQGQEIIKELVKQCDVLVENFRPGTMERWNLGYETLAEINPQLVMVRITGYGQTGPYRDKPGFGRVAQAFGGLTYLAGFPDQPPVTPGSPTIADYLAGLYGAIATLVALEHRRSTSKGQCIDISLYESVFRILDNLTIAYQKLGIVRERTGTATSYVVPHNHYPTRDGKWVAIACTTDRIFERLAKAMSRGELARDPRYRTGDKRVENREQVDEMVSEWTSTIDLRELVELLDENEVPISPINSIADIFEDPHIQARGSIIEVDDPVLGKTKMPGVVPRLSESPGRVERLAPSLGQHNQEIYGDLLGYSKERLSILEQEGVI